MSNPLLPLHFPQASDATLIGLAATLGGLVLGAIGWDSYRRWNRRRQTIRAEWDMVHDLFREKDLKSSQQTTLDGMLRRYAPQTPLSAVTVRQQFDALVDKQMRQERDRHGLTQFQEMGKDLYEIRVRLGLDYVPYGHSIRSTRELRTGQVLWFAQPTRNSEWIMGKIEALDEAYFGVGLRQSAARLTLAPGDNVAFRLWREDDGRYLFDTPLALGPTGDPPVWYLHHTTTLSRTQERCFYRVRCDIETQIEQMKDTSPGMADEPMLLPVRLVSLSGGGFAALSQRALPHGTAVRLFLDLPEEKPLSVESRLIGSNPLGAGRYILRGQFLGAYQEAQDVIARYVARRQRPATEEIFAVENR